MEAAILDRGAAGGRFMVVALIAMLASPGCFGGGGAGVDVPAAAGDAGPGAGEDNAGASAEGGGGAGGAGGEPPGGGIGGNAGEPPVGGIGGGPPATGGTGPGGECIDQVTSPAASMDAVHLVIDGSGSMCDVLGGPTRWQALRAALLDPIYGLIYRLEASVPFGLLIYDGTIDLLLAAGGAGTTPGPACAGAYASTKTMGECPLLLEVPAARGNATAIDASFPQTELGGSTPTDKALSILVDRLLSTGDSGQIVLITDGLPNDICVGGTGDPSVAQLGVVTQVQRAAAAGIPTRVIGFTGGDPTLEAHLTAVAQAGDPGNPGAAAAFPQTPESLTAELQRLITAVPGCEFTLDGAVEPGRECTGLVQLDGQALACCVELPSGFSCDGAPAPNPDGWRLKAPDTIELLGQSCVEYHATGGTLRATFPCDLLPP